MRAVLRLGLLYLLALLLLFAFGHRNQMERRALLGLEARIQTLAAEEEALTRAKWAQIRPLRLLDWAEAQGFIPMSQGRWP